MKGAIAVLALLCVSGCNESTLSPGNGDLSTSDLSMIPLCAGPPRFVPVPQDAGSPYEFCPRTVKPCAGQKLDLLGQNFACADVQVEILGQPATIVAYTPTFCANQSLAGITILMPNLSALLNPDAGSLVTTKIHVSNLQGAVDSDYDLAIITGGSC
jgi:hypothetical protein